MVFVCNSFQQAIHKVHTYNRLFDLMITDLYLGDGKGTDLMHMMMMGNKCPKSVILITGSEFYPAKKNPGFDDYMAKPISLNTLYTTVRSCISLHNL